MAVVVQVQYEGQTSGAFQNPLRQLTARVPSILPRPVKHTFCHTLISTLSEAFDFVYDLAKKKVITDERHSEDPQAILLQD